MARACGGDELTEEWIGAGTLDPWQQTMGLDLDAMLEDLGKAKEGSVFVLHTYESYSMSCRVSLLHLCARVHSETCVGKAAYQMCMQRSVTARGQATRFWHKASRQHDSDTSMLSTGWPTTPRVWTQLRSNGRRSRIWPRPRRPSASSILPTRCRSTLALCLSCGWRLAAVAWPGRALARQYAVKRTNWRHASMQSRE
jgi:hypothetical protein